VWINDILSPGIIFITSSAEANRTGDCNWTFYNVGVGNHSLTITVQIYSSVPYGTVLTNFVHLYHTDSSGIPGPSSWDSADVTIGNQPPGAYAGPDQIVNEGDVVQFNGTGSYAPNSIVDNYEWDFNSSDGLWWETGAPPDATGPTPTHVYGDDGVYNTTLRVRINVQGGVGVNSAHDLVFVIDSSGSMMSSDPDDLRIIESQKFISNHFELPDRAAVIEFDDNAVLVPERNPNGDHLHTNYARIINNLGLIDHYDGSLIWRGMNLSNEEIYQYGNPFHKRVIIILTDGGQIDSDPVERYNSFNEANISASHGTIIFTIGLNIPSGNQREQILQDIANITGGQYFLATNSTDFEAIYEEIKEIVENRSLELYDTDTMQVTVGNVIPTITPFGPFATYEGSPMTFSTTATDLGSDDLTFTWSWGDGTPDVIKIHYNDGIAPDPYPSPWGTFPFIANETEQHIYINKGVYLLNITVEDDDGGVTKYSTTVMVIDVAPPNLYINVSQNGEDIILYWDPPSIPDIDHYLIYRSTSQTDFDFNTVWMNTSKDYESGEPGPIPLRTMWNDTNAALPGNESNYKEQYCYIIRAVDVLGGISGTSRTVGKWTKSFPQNVSTFSLPLEPLETMNTTIDHYLTDMNARYIKWMDPVYHVWMKHGDGEVNETPLEVGKGYEISFDLPTNYTFTGLPGAMIRYDDHSTFSGFNPASDARSLTVIVEPETGNITINWTQPACMGINDHYYVYRSTERDGFWKGNYLKIATLDFDVLSYTDIGNATAGTQYYYMIVPVNETGTEGTSTYSIGVWTEDFLPQYDTIGIPLKLNNNQTVDWYCDNISYTVGMNYFTISQQRWDWHSTKMVAGAFDPILVMTEGYQISTLNTTRFTFIGV
jgi:hypothetical protein